MVLEEFGVSSSYEFFNPNKIFRLYFLRNCVNFFVIILVVYSSLRCCHVMNNDIAITFHLPKSNATPSVCGFLLGILKNLHIIFCYPILTWQSFAFLWGSAEL